LPGCANIRTMSDTADKLSREERLAIKLRENLRRRKAQSREIDDRTAGATDAIYPEHGHSKQALSKEPRNS
jgi:hypothetical protein